MSISSERIVWIDCEMTGLDLTQDALIEIGVLVTDSDLNILGEGVELVIKPGSEAPAGALENMNSYVRNMHESSGLLEDLEHGVSMHEAQEAVLKYVKKYVPVAGKAQLGGNSVGMDKRFLERDMPDLMKHLHYRVIDVSHIKDSIDELKYYRRAIFVPDAPDAITAARIARDVEVERQTLEKA